MNVVEKYMTTLFALLAVFLSAPMVYVLATGDFPGASSFYGFEEDSAVVDWVFTVREFFVR